MHMAYYDTEMHGNDLNFLSSEDFQSVIENGRSSLIQVSYLIASFLLYDRNI